jgi:hypothetical protein
LPGKSPVPATHKPAFYLIGNDITGVVSITIEDFSVWTESNTSVINIIENFYGNSDNIYGPNDGLEVLAPGATPIPYEGTQVLIPLLRHQQDG